MASIEAHTPAAARRLDVADLAGVLALSASANWNQNDADWRTMLALGEAWGIDASAPDGRRQLAASTVFLPYGPFAWVSMVLVLPEFRRRGYATQLLRQALALLAQRGVSAVLDATPAGHAVYSQLGFVDTWGFARYRRDRAPVATARPAAPGTHSLRESDWPAIDALDAPAFGASRLPLLRHLALRWPRAARVMHHGGRLSGFVFGRDGREAHQIGPLLANDPSTAMSLLDDVLGAVAGPVYLDLLDSRKALLPWLQERGFQLQRPFTRMVSGATQAPGDPRPIVLVAGPELG